MAHASGNKPSTAECSAPQGLDDAARASARRPVEEFLNGVFEGLIERRRETWNRLVSGAFAEIQKRAGVPGGEQILGSDPFLTFVTEATLIACRNHDEEKLRALRNAVVHAALPEGTDELLQLMFLRLIDYLTPLHLAAVAILDDPVKWMERNDVPHPRWPVGTPEKVIEYCVPSLQGRPNIVEMVVRDLQGAGLVEQGYFLRMPMSDAGYLQSHTTDSGRQFVRCILAA
ncbi:MAG: hypothetical protein HYY78_21525 [Betaproteobacteria bacterium]|nr:hypothetical protein [Betaproteobacteria bacterium]